MRKILIILFVFLGLNSFAQTRCDNAYNASMLIGYEMNASFSHPSFTVDFGLTGQRSPLCFYGGVRSVSQDWLDAGAGTKTSSTTNNNNGINIAVVPTFTTMYKWKRNEYDSKLVHCIAAQVGTHNFYSVQYRCYLSTGDNGRSTMGLTAGYNSYNNISVGVSFLGIF
jgi:hypothetical protein